MRTGDFYSLPEIQQLGKAGSKLKPRAVERLFNDKEDRELLPPELITQILTIIDKAFIDHLCIDGQPIDRFGSADKQFTEALDNYNFDILSKLDKWQKDYERDNGRLDIQLAGRVAYATRYGADDTPPRPLLSASFVIALDKIFARIPTVIREVSSHFICYPVSISPRCALTHNAWNTRRSFACIPRVV